MKYTDQNTLLNVVIIEKVQKPDSSKILKLKPLYLQTPVVYLYDHKLQAKCKDRNTILQNAVLNIEQSIFSEVLNRKDQIFSSSISDETISKFFVSCVNTEVGTVEVQTELTDPNQEYLCILEVNYVSLRGKEIKIGISVNQLKTLANKECLIDSSDSESVASIESNESIELQDLETLF
jgi:hypothetical protein